LTTQEDSSSRHWLVRPQTIGRLWIGASVLLVMLVLLQFVLPIKGHFGVDGWFGFAPAFGFFACVLMVVVARALGAMLKQPEKFYDDA
jgi:sterol desaturase/sphingolipid hydroxylase (fatty acid hydroxylase superfamily)